MRRRPIICYRTSMSATKSEISRVMAAMRARVSEPKRRAGMCRAWAEATPEARQARIDAALRGRGIDPGKRPKRAKSKRRKAK